MKYLILTFLFLVQNLANAQVENKAEVEKKILHYTEVINSKNKNYSRKLLETSYIERGKLYIELERYHEAISDFTFSLKYNDGFILNVKSNNPESWGGLGICNFFLQDYKEAISDFHTALRYSPHKVEYLVYRGTSYMKLKQFDDAIKDYTTILENFAQNGTVQNVSTCEYLRGQCYYLKNSFTLAINDFSKALEQDFTDPMLWHSRGMAFLKVGKYNLAIKDFSSAIMLDSSSSTYWKSRADVFCLKEMYDSAAYDDFQAYSKDTTLRSILFQINYKDDLLKLKLQPLFNKMVEYQKQKDYTNAIKQCNSILLIDSLNRGALFMRGFFYYQQNKFKSVIKDFLTIEAIENGGLILRSEFETIYQRTGGFYNILGLSYSKDGLGDSAILCFNKAIEKDSLNNVYYCNRGSTYYYLQKEDLAFSDFQKSLNLDSNYAEAWGYMDCVIRQKLIIMQQ
jgi:tetratricopeptide (TPR) repeat protein